MGSTMQAAILLCRNKKARSIIVASPVADPSTAAALAKIVDDVVILERVVVPEPGTLVLLGIGAACMLLKRHRRRARA